MVAAEKGDASVQIKNCCVLESILTAGQALCSKAVIRPQYDKSESEYHNIKYVNNFELTAYSAAIVCLWLSTWLRG